MNQPRRIGDLVQEFLVRAEREAFPLGKRQGPGAPPPPGTPRTHWRNTPTLPPTKRSLSHGTRPTCPTLTNTTVLVVAGNLDARGLADVVRRRLVSDAPHRGAVHGGCLLVRGARGRS